MRPSRTHCSTSRSHTSQTLATTCCSPREPRGGGDRRAMVYVNHKQSTEMQRNQGATGRLNDRQCTLFTRP